MNFISKYVFILKSSCYQLLDSRIKNMVFHLKKIGYFDLTLTTSPKVKSIILSYVPLRTFLFETFFRIYHSFREILMHCLKWDILYKYTHAHAHTHTHTRTHTRTCTRTHTHAHARTRTQNTNIYIYAYILHIYCC